MKGMNGKLIQKILLSLKLLLLLFLLHGETPSSKNLSVLSDTTNERENIKIDIAVFL